MERNLYKVVLVGDVGVGKSTFVNRLKKTEKRDKNTRTRVVDATCTRVYTFGGQVVTVSRRVDVVIVTAHFMYCSLLMYPTSSLRFVTRQAKKPTGVSPQVSTGEPMWPYSCTARTNLSPK